MQCNKCGGELDGRTMVSAGNTVLCRNCAGSLFISLRDEVEDLRVAFRKQGVTITELRAIVDTLPKIGRLNDAGDKIVWDVPISVGGMYYWIYLCPPNGSEPREWRVCHSRVQTIERHEYSDEVVWLVNEEEPSKLFSTHAAAEFAIEEARKS